MALIDTLRELHIKTSKLYSEKLSDLDLKTDYFGIYSHESKVYDQLLEEASKLGEFKAEHSTGAIFELNKDIKIEDSDVRRIQIVIPREDRKGLQGYLSVYSENFESIKSELSKNYELQSVDGYERFMIRNKGEDFMIFVNSVKVTQYHINGGKQQTAGSSEENTTKIPDHRAYRQAGAGDDKQGNNFEKLYNEEKVRRMQLMADFENYRRRLETERATFGAIANMGLIQELLEIHDDLELAMQDGDLNLENAKNSIKTAQDKLVASVKSAGIERVDVKIGDSFDKEKMEAISTVPNPEMKDKVIAVISSAYKYAGQDGILKPAKVVVGK